ncbi:MAG: hypothetical protein FWC53_02410 [Firmicutes bacterium]|nr:hypothetical protein [Bacillota bacterium]
MSKEIGPFRKGLIAAAAGLAVVGGAGCSPDNSDPQATATWDITDKAEEPLPTQEDLQKMYDTLQEGMRKDSSTMTKDDIISLADTFKALYRYCDSYEAFKGIKIEFSGMPWLSLLSIQSSKIAAMLQMKDAVIAPISRDKYQSNDDIENMRLFIRVYLTAGVNSQEPLSNLKIAKLNGDFVVMENSGLVGKYNMQGTLSRTETSDTEKAAAALVAVPITGENDRTIPDVSISKPQLEASK